MKKYKVEIILSHSYMDELLQELEAIDVKGYTALEISRGKGIKRGEMLAEGLLPTTRTSLFFMITGASEMNRIIERMEPFLELRGGAMFTTRIKYATGL